MDRLRSRGVATLPVCVAVVVACALTLGVGSRDARSAVVDGVSWLLSRDGDTIRLTRASGSSGAAEKRTFLQGVDGDVEVIQRDGAVYIRVGDEVRRLDDGLSVVEAGTAVPPGQHLVVGDDEVWVVDGEAGEVWASDPETLARVGDTVSVPKGVTSAVYGLDARLWVASPDTGEVVGLERRAGGAALAERLSVGEPGPTEVLLQDGMPLVVSAASHRVHTLRDGVVGAGYALPEDLGADGLVVAEAARGDLIPVLDQGQHRLALASPREPVSVQLPASGDYGAPVGFAGRAYVPDLAGASVVVVAAAGQVLEEISVPGARAGDEFEMRLDGGFLWINDPASRTALVIGPDGEPRTVDKYDPEAQGPTPDDADASGPEEDVPPDDDVPPPPDAPPAPASTTPTSSGGAPAPLLPPAVPPPADPVAPSAPIITAAAPSDRSVAVSWQLGPDGGAAIEDVEIAWTSDEGDDRRTVDGGASTEPIEGLRNGVTYTFTVRARSSVGWSPPSAPVDARPSNRVPDAPGGVEAEVTPANADGSVTVGWEVADGQGFEVGSYKVYAIDVSAGDVPGGTAPPIESMTLVADQVGTGSCADRCTVDVPAQGGWLGVPQRFSVVADSTAAGGATSEPSAPSAVVEPARPPDPAEDIVPTTTSGDGRTLELTATVPFDGGHDIDEVTYRVDDVDGGDAGSCTAAGDGTATCSLTVSVPDRQVGHRVEIVVANDMGPAPATLIDVPAKGAPVADISVTSPTYNVVRVVWSSSGDDVTCQVSGPGLSTTECNGSIDIPMGAGEHPYSISAASPYYDAAGDTDSATVSNPPPPPPSVSVSRGGHKTVNGCSSSQCAWVVVSVANMSGPYTVQCYSDMDANPYWTYTTTATTSQTCVFGYSGRRVWAVVNGVRSPSITW